jgi:NADH-quinone oxidoreductase subunit E
MNAPMLLSPEALAIDREIAKYPPSAEESAVMAALTIAQEEKGWLSTETMDFVAQYLACRRSRCTRWRRSTRCTT